MPCALSAFLAPRGDITIFVSFLLKLSHLSRAKEKAVQSPRCDAWPVHLMQASAHASAATRISALEARIAYLLAHLDDVGGLEKRGFYFLPEEVQAGVRRARQAAGGSGSVG